MVEKDIASSLKENASLNEKLGSLSDELKTNGYFILRGQKLKEFKKLYFGTLMNEGTKTTVLGFFPSKTHGQAVSDHSAKH